MHSYGYDTNTAEGLQRLGHCSVPMSLIKQGGVFLVPHLSLHETSVFWVSAELPTYLVALYYWGYGGPILTWILGMG